MTVRLLVLGVYAALVLAAMVLPEAQGLPRFLYADKIVHFFIFAVFGLLSSWALPKKHVMPITCSVLFAVGTEVAQLGVPYRRFEVGDLFADGLGVVLGVSSYLLFALVLDRLLSDMRTR